MREANSHSGSGQERNVEPTKNIKELACQYSDVASIHGVRYFGGSNPVSSYTRVLWAFLFIVSLINGLYIFYPIWQNFMDKATLNLKETVSLNQFEFPAITFCNANYYRKSVIGHSIEGFVSMNAKMRRNVSDARKLCAAKPFYDTVNNFIGSKDLYDKIFSSVNAGAAHFGYYVLMLFTPTSFQSVQSCRFKGKRLSDFDCLSAFQNRFLSDQKVCFTFNPSDTNRNFSVKALNQNMPASGSSTFPAPLPGVVDFKVKSHGISTAVEFLLNLQQDEYCETGDTDGAGFVMQVHSRDVQPIFNDLMHDTILLSPGKDITVTVEETHTVRETESAGWCSSTVDLKYYKFLKHNDQNACFNECMTELILSKCNCLPSYAATAALLDLAEKHGIAKDVTAIYKFLLSVFCNDEDPKNKTLTCNLKTVQYLLREKSITQECPQCKIPCFERKYTTQKTQSDFPAINNFHIYQNLRHPVINYTAIRELSHEHGFKVAVNYLQTLDRRTYGVAEPFFNVDEARRNLINLRIQLKSMNVVINTERFSVSVSMLITQLGGAVSLFIGASVLSFVEIFYWCYVGLSRNCQ